MTAELEEQVEKKNEADIVEEKKSVEDEKIHSDKEEELIKEDNPQNGGGNDLKKEESEKQAGAAQDEEEEVTVVAPRRRAPRFWERLFKRSGTRQDDVKQDVEAGTELLAKDKDGKIEIKEGEGKQEKNDTGTDVTIAVADEKEADGANEDSAGGKAEDKPQNARAYWRHVAIGLLVIVVVLIVVAVISILTSSKNDGRGPMVQPLVITDCGPVRGRIEDEVYVFRGIPYAMPPVGDRRWKAPEAPSNLEDCWTGTYEAYNSSAICFQKLILNYDIEMSEDCLYLDVISPSLSPVKLRPVVVYIPGDQPLVGYSAFDMPWRPSAKLADEKDITFVTINYRTSVFGFLTLDILSDSVRPPSSGNYGIMDMMAALRWVQRNIRNFGGDPEKVTILAHGGGATASLALLSSRKADNLFRQMWLTAPSAHFSNKTLKQVGEDNSSFLKRLNCEAIDCIYNKSAEEIVQATPDFWDLSSSTDIVNADDVQMPVMVVVDGDILQNTPLNLWKSGDVNRVPVVIGSAAQEAGYSTILPDLDKWTWSDFSDYIMEKFGAISHNLTVSATEFYIQNSSTPLEQFYTMISDIRTLCPLQRLTQALDDTLERDVYWYIVDYKPTSPVQFSNASAAVRLSVHGLDIAAIFGRLGQYVTPMSMSDEKFQKNMQDLFYSYVYTGTPEIHKELLMASNFINFIGDTVHAKMAPYENCHVWDNDYVYPTYAKMN